MHDIPMFASSFAADGINRASAPAVTPDSWREYAWSTLIRSATTQLVDSCMSKAAASFKPWSVVVETCRLRDQRVGASDASGVLASMLNQHATTRSACTVDSAAADPHAAVQPEALRGAGSQRTSQSRRIDPTTAKIFFPITVAACGPMV